LNSAREKLTAANLRDFFQVLSTGDQVSQGKPHPEIFLKAADKLSLPPTVESAARAGTTTWMVVDRVQPTERARSLAWRVVGSLLHVRDEFRALVEREQN
jgi:beta-phosphoglucomutase-like phosphatase (HAD superfamily)